MTDCFDAMRSVERLISEQESMYASIGSLTYAVSHNCSDIFALNWAESKVGLSDEQARAC